MMHPIPDKLLFSPSHIAILATTGAGKTVAAKGLAERVVLAGERMCALDPKDAWWGMRAKGKGPGLPVVVFGGNHADYPITRYHGRMLAEIVGKSEVQCIISTQLFNVAERTDFFIDFAETLNRVHKGISHLFIDESHLFIPQKVDWGGRSGQMVHAGNELVSGGRGLGLRICLISQRAQKLHKDSLAMCPTLIAMQVTHPLDRGAIDDWMGEFIDTDDAKSLPISPKEFRQSLTALKRGEAWVWAPQHHIMKRVQFPMIQTYDSSAPGGGKRKPRMMKINLDAIKDRLGAVAKEAEENDVPRLKGLISGLRRDLEAEKKRKVPPAPLAKPGKPVADQKAIKAAEDRGHTLGHAIGMRDGFHEASKHYEAGAAKIASALSLGTKRLGEIQRAAEAASEKFKREHKAPVPILLETVAPRPAHHRVATPPRSMPIAVADGIELKGPERRILGSLVVWKSLGHDQPTRSQVAFVAGYSPDGSAFTNPLGALKSAERIVYPGTGRVQILNPEGAHDFGGTPAVDALLARLKGPERRILNAVRQGRATRAVIAERAQYSPDGSAFTNPLGRLRTLELIEYPATGEVEMTGWAAELLGSV